MEVPEQVAAKPPGIDTGHMHPRLDEAVGNRIAGEQPQQRLQIPCAQRCDVSHSATLGLARLVGGDLR